MRVAVVGGGIAGLAAAWELASRGAEVAVYEPGHLGGKLLTSDFLGRPVDEGADALLARVPEGTGLCRELGLGEELVAPAASKAMLWCDGKLRPLPDGLVLGAPARLLPLARSGILSMAGMARALGDLVLPSTPFRDDESVFDVVAARFGPEVAAKLVDPLIGSIYAGTTKELSAATAAPQLLAAAKVRRSLLASLRRTTPAPPNTADGAAQLQPVFVAPRGGMQAIANRLVELLGGPAMGTQFFPTEVTALHPDGVGLVISPGDEHYDGVVCAAPAPAASRLLGPLVGPSGDGLGALAGERFASVGVVTLGFEQRAIAVPPGQSGVLVGPGSDLLMTACSFGSSKWPHWSSPGTVLLRVSVGKVSDQRWASLADEDLVARLLAELETVLGAHAGAGTGGAGPRPAGGPGAPDRRAGRPAALTPLAGGWRVSRWPSALPQYPVGHLANMAALRALISRRAPTVALAGASYGRVGVPACIAAGRRAGAEVFKAVQSLREPAA